MSLHITFKVTRSAFSCLFLYVVSYCSARTVFFFIVSQFNRTVTTHFIYQGSNSTSVFLVIYVEAQ